MPRRDGQGQERGFRKSAEFTIAQYMDKLGQELTGTRADRRGKTHGQVRTGEHDGWTSVDRKRQWMDKCGQVATWRRQVRALTAAKDLI